MRRKLSRKGLVKKTEDAWKKLAKAQIRHCEHCGKTPTNPSDLHVDHIRPKSRGHVYRFSTINALVLCFHCHINWKHKDPLDFSKWFREAFPGRDEQLDALKPRKYSDLELQVILQDLETQLKEKEKEERL